MLSVHRSVQSGYPNTDFDGFECSELDKLGHFMVQRVYSPIIFAGGTRNAIFFRCASWCVLDFDETSSRQEVREKLKLRGLKHLIAPTKSDWIDKTSSSGKVKPARDRFRLIIPFKQTIWDRDVFEYNMRLQIAWWNADPLPYDAGRVWQPSLKGVETLVGIGESLDVNLSVPVEETQSHKTEKIRDWAQERSKAHRWPERVRRFLNGDIPDGERNNELFYTACFMFNAGWTVEQFRKFLYAEIPAMIGHDKLETTIASAARRTGAAYF